MISKRSKEIKKNVESDKLYTFAEAVDIIKKCPTLKFDETIDMSIKLGVDTRKADQQVRGTVTLPHGTGKTISIVVIAQGDKVQEAIDAGADHVGNKEIIEKIKGGWTGFDVIIATPDMMREIGKLGKILGPRGLMPTPKAGTVTMDVAKAVKEVKLGKIEYKFDKHGVINLAVGKLSFDAENIVDNIKTVLKAIWRAKPAAVKGKYIQSLFISSTMGPGIKIEEKEIQLT
ncbi:MAG: 50S ribosomal protein L1 [Waddliaceae bacterium]|jgi:large subunit ribosomal protein L1|nr:50S ribosomal protein L1 [Waddliaceae bacterium]MBT3579078.1 50S ribosomal protein L1 [Waddliaceae bacterium]MBT4444789.1 50S ribosomal protein L1 [Waddliaceae bacterium]MBT6928058.1 50S ribosomal protein L1 [Waddliaceae bacterium]MBT7264442.1 50S ribosomal protein L1 [Waddliaceae bacterium]